jgi:hypothetical protein
MPALNYHERHCSGGSGHPTVAGMRQNGKNKTRGPERIAGQNKKDETGVD